MTMPVRDLLSLGDLPPGVLESLVERSVEHSLGDPARSLEGRSIGLLFKNTSTRTRTSFWVAAQRLGADVIAYRAGDLQTETGESLEDTIRVLSQYLDALVVRASDGPFEVEAMTSVSREMPIINAMSSREHPSQAVADLSVLRSRFGSLDGLELLYLGEGNNTAVALALALAVTGRVNATFVTPKGFGLPEVAWRRAVELAEERGAVLQERHDLVALQRRAHVLYTTRWRTTGTVKSMPESEWRQRFEPLRVTEDLFERFARPDAIFMHDLPAVRGEECTAEVLHGRRSIALEQARHKLFAAKAILEWCVVGGKG